MKILYLAHRLPFPPDKGDRLRAFREIQHLSRHHEVWCACFADQPGYAEAAAQLRPHCAKLAIIRLHRPVALMRGMIGLACGRTLTESYYASATLTRQLRRWSSATQFDAVVAFSSSMAPHALRVSAERHVLDMCDLDSQKWLSYASQGAWAMRILYRKEGLRLARREREWLGAFDATILITAAEAVPLRHLPRANRIHVVGNGVAVPADHEHSERRPTIGFVGVMDYRPNVDAVCWFVENCWSAIRNACPGAVFRIVGQSPTRQVRALANVPGVYVVGRVEDVIAEVQRFDVSVAPMQIARGLQNKVLEAMAASKPVVLSAKAAEGLTARHHRDYLIADDPRDTVAAVVTLLRSPKERLRLGTSARQFVAKHHRWDAHMRRFEWLVTGMTAARSGPPLAMPAAALAPQEDHARDAVV